MSGAAESNKLSTSALAKALAIPLQQLFVTLRDYGWIRKVDDGWLLTAKGEFEGGEYVHSRRFGRYIVWPPSVLEHQLIRGIESNRLLNAAQIARKYQITAREVRRLLGELGFLQRTFNGWTLTRHGEQLGGIAIDSDSGDSDIQWPEAILENAVVAAQLEYVQRLYGHSDDREGDLLSTITALQALDGHRFHSRGEWIICHWLYFAGINHACHRRLPFAPTQTQTQDYFADFWLPEAQVYLEYAGDEQDAAEIAATMDRIEIYRKNGWRYVEVQAEHLAHLDEYLTRQLQELGVRVF